MSSFPKVSNPAIFVNTQRSTPGYLQVAAAIYLYLKQSGAKPEFVFDRDQETASELKNLLGEGVNLKSEISEKKFAIKLRKSGAEVDNVQWQQNEKDLNIYISVAQGTLSARDLEFQVSGSNYDLGVILAETELGKLGDVYQSNPDFFTELRLFSVGSELNLDGSYEFTSANKPNLTTLAEQALSAMDYSAIDEKVAQLLYNAIILATNGLSSNIKSGEIFMNLKRLVDRGARPEQASA